mmetsp:Transcript_41003/g.68868  ORF Transcript_41003/g.68868 Transcript_41003/m.68868 type:complete len:210 (+) Transcript_41003:699-1328(+)
MVSFLVSACPELLDYRATGQFFRPGTQSYYGETPLNFAVCKNQGDMVRLLLDAGADLTQTDGFEGNTAVHMAILHDHMGMYDLLLAEWEARRASRPDWSDPDTCLTQRPNRNGLCSLALAAAEGTPVMFDHVLNLTGQVILQHGKTTFTLHPMEGFRKTGRKSKLRRGRKSKLWRVAIKFADKFSHQSSTTRMAPHRITMKSCPRSSTT